MKSFSTAEAAQGRWPSILMALGLPASCLVGKHGACPICADGKDRFRFDDLDGRGTYICSHCGAGDGIDLVAKALKISKREALARVDEVIGRGDLPITPAPQRQTEEERIADARAIYARGVPVTSGDPVDLYLHGRGVGELPGGYPATMRFDPVTGAMLMPIQSVERSIVGVHQTFLTRDGRKADVEVPKKVRGVMPAGAAIRFSPAQEVLGIAEGIETAMSASALYDIPVWAAVNSGGMERWEPPVGCREVAIFADKDDSFEGQRAAYALAKRLRMRGLRVTVHTPEAEGDFNDVLIGRRA